MSKESIKSNKNPNMNQLNMYDKPTCCSTINLSDQPLRHAYLTNSIKHFEPEVVIKMLSNIFEL